MMQKQLSVVLIVCPHHQQGIDSVIVECAPAGRDKSFHTRKLPLALNRAWLHDT